MTNLEFSKVKMCLDILDVHQKQECNSPVLYIWRWILEVKYDRQSYFLNTPLYQALLFHVEND